MKQVQIPRHGDPSVLRVVERPDPEPGPGELRVAVRAAGLNFADILARMGLYKDAPPLPAVMGYEVSGVVDRVGPGTDEALLGRQVVAMTRFGGHSTHVLVTPAALLDLPEGMSFAEGAALPVVYLTAYHMLIYLGNLHRGERVLIHSAGGGVGIAAIQLARHLDAEIFGTASQAKHERLRALGVQHPIDYTSEDFEAVIRERTGGKGVHIALDPVGGASLSRSYRSLAKNGRLFCFGISSFSAGGKRSWLRAAGQLLRMRRFHPLRLMLDNRGVFGVNLGQLWDQAELIRGELSALMDLYHQGVVAPPVDRSFPLEQAAEAHAYIQDRKNFGKVVLSCGEPDPSGG
jgi:NADPH:quinone reductase-like Zn-dependent oxidoreductase